MAQSPQTVTSPVGSPPYLSETTLNGGANALLNSPTYGGTTNSTGSNTTTGTSTTGFQPSGNVYPTGIYGAGPGGSGTALGTTTDDELVQNRLTGLLNSNSPYIQQARQQATQQANSRGLLNSSMAAANAQAAAIQSSLPIASQDANTIAGLQTTNLNNLSKAQIQNLQNQGQLAAASSAGAHQANAARITAENQLQMQRENLAYSGEQAGLNRSFTGGLTQQEYQNQLGLGQQQYQNTYGIDTLQSGLQYNNQYGLNNQQAAINSGASYQNYTQNAALSGQGYQQNLGLGEFNLGGSLLQGNQSFWNNLGITGLSNPGAMGDPQAFLGYGQSITGQTTGIIDSVLNYALGGGNFGG